MTYLHEDLTHFGTKNSSQDCKQPVYQNTLSVMCAACHVQSVANSRVLNFFLCGKMKTGTAKQQ